MARQRKASNSSGFGALTIEGSLIAPAMIARVAEREADGQKPADYGVPKGLQIRDEIARFFRIGQALFEEFSKADAPTTKRTHDFVETLLRDVFGFADIARVGHRTIDGRDFAVTFEAARGRIPIIVTPPSDGLDQPSNSLPGDGRRKSAASACQDWLNANDDALWGIAVNGEKLRLLRDNESLTRPAYIEADLRQMFEAEDFASFSAFWLLIHSSRFGAAGTSVADCALERWREESAKEGVAARDRLRDGVAAALKILGEGFLANSANEDLKNRLRDGSLALNVYFAELLRLVYRFIFLFAAEDRNLLHPTDANQLARRLYAEGYSLASLRERSTRRAAWDRYADKWEGLKIVFAALSRGEKRLGLPALGGIFAADATPNLDKLSLSNRALMEAIYKLAWLKDDGGLVPINWRDMQTEELGSVYESLLELTPRLTEGGRGFEFAEGAETKGNARKTSGSYYTPDSLVQALLDTALDPVLDQAEAGAEDAAAALLSLTVIDPACGSGHFLLAAARRIAGRVARAKAGGVASAEDYRHALRDVVRNCIHGVDRNPMAVELAKVALWIETVDPGKPLGFLDANIRCGDALFGVFDLEALRKGVPDDAFAPLTGDDRDTARHFLKLNRSEREGEGTFDFVRGGGRLPEPPPLAKAAIAVRAMPEETPADIAEKKKRFDAARADRNLWNWRMAADIYCAAFLTPKSGGVPKNRTTATIPTTEAVWQSINGKTVYGPLVGLAQERAGEARAFHWPLEFPEIFAAGGFDCVLGNPPWEVMQLGEEEYFAQRLPEISELKGAARKRAIAKLEQDSPKIFEQFEADKRRFEAVNQFARASGRFDLTARGKINTYGLFAELFSSLISPRGRAGVIVPTGIATDATTAPFFAALIDGKRLASLIDFENREAIFHAVHRSFKFSLLTIGRNVEAARFAFFLTQPAQLHEAERNFTLSPADIARINPNTKTAPVFRSRRDAELTAKIYSRVPVLIDESKGRDGNPWGVEFRQGLFNMTSDSGLFRTAAQLRAAGFERDGTDWVKRGYGPKQKAMDLKGGKAAGALALDGGARETRYVPLYEAKMISFFDHRFAGYAARGDDRGYRVLPETALDEHQDPNFEVEPFYWVAKTELEGRLSDRTKLGWLMGWKDVTAATNERTAIFSVIPRVAVGHTLPLMFSTKDTNRLSGLYANLNAIVTDYTARNSVAGLHLTYGYLKQFPVFGPDFYTEPRLAFITPKVLELTYTSHSLAPFARDLGHDGPPFAWDEDRRALLRADLDAFYARAYGLTRDELRYILDPADVKGPDYPSETFRVLKEKEIRQHGEYRTARLVLEAWDREEKERK